LFVDELGSVVEGAARGGAGPLMGTNPRLRQLARSFLDAKRDRRHSRSPLFRRPLGELREMLTSEGGEDQQVLLDCLRELRTLLDLDAGEDSILPDVLSSTQEATRDFHLYNERQVSPILRARSSDRLCLKLLRWLHDAHPLTRDVPLALSDEAFSIWPVRPTIY